MKVSRLMSKNVKTCRPADKLSTAAQIMWDNDCGCVPVVDDQERVISMITDRDICMAALTRGIPIQQILVQDAMAKTLFTCRPDDSIAQAEKLMRTNRVRRLPVIDQTGRLVGVLSLNDIAREVMRERVAKVAPEVTPDELTATLAAVCSPHNNRAHLS